MSDPDNDNLAKTLYPPRTREDLAIRVCRIGDVLGFARRVGRSDEVVRISLTSYQITGHGTMLTALKEELKRLLPTPMTTYQPLRMAGQGRLLGLKKTSEEDPPTGGRQTKEAETPSVKGAARHRPRTSFCLSPAKPSSSPVNPSGAANDGGTPLNFLPIFPFPILPPVLVFVE
ncbi:hypothetical protein HPB50_010803 [Hyalomma asiaticum]|uniref:Uncharacterized protein n=1 Tax=Hyalomma asiaticum TaxID=266040 RepID=A0ACB7SML9_HYAAI|nr:hypothetical protein HPB50_010803 [Hyalomma asiaticum]